MWVSYSGDYEEQETCFHAAFLLGLFLHPEDGGDMFLQNVGWLSTDYTALYSKRQYSSEFSNFPWWRNETSLSDNATSQTF
jgi:hypothetical protein